jgi:outer membrane protein TolC
VVIRCALVQSAHEREATLQRLVAEGRAVELLSAHVALKRAEAEQGLASAQAASASTQAALLAMLGSAPQLVAVDLVQAAWAVLESPQSPGQPASVAAAEARAQMADARGKALTGAVLPTVALRASAMYANPDTTQFPVVNEWDTYWDASLVATWTLDGGVRLNEASAARADANAAEAGVQALERQNEAALAGALASLQSAPARLELAAEGVAMAQWAVDSAETALANGRLTHADVMDREAELAMARAGELQVAMSILLESESTRSLSGAFGPSSGPVSSPAAAP